MDLDILSWSRSRLLCLVYLVIGLVTIPGPTVAAASSRPATSVDQPAWSARFNGTGNGDDRATDVGVSPDGSRVFVTGRTYGAGPGDDYGTVAYDAASGAELWVATYNGPGNGDDVATALAVSPDGATVFVTGIVSGSSGHSDYGTIAYDAATGDPSWVALYEGGGDKFAYAMAVSPDGGTVFVTGESSGGATIAYDAGTGSQLWSGLFPGVAFAAGVSPDGTTVFVTGYAMNDYATEAYDAATGDRLWVARYDGPGHSSDQSYALGVSPDGGTVYVTGQSWGNGTEGDYATIAYGAAAGTRQWVARYDGPANSFDSAFDLGVSPDGATVFVTGYSLGVGTNYDYATLAYDAGTGSKRWGARYDDARDGFDQAYALAVSPDGTAVYVTGQSAGSGSLDDYATVTYRAATGAQGGVSRIGPGSPIAVRVSSDGSRVFVTGSSGIYGVTPTDYGTVAYSVP